MGSSAMMMVVIGGGALLVVIVLAAVGLYIYFKNKDEIPHTTGPPSGGGPPGSKAAQARFVSQKLDDKKSYFSCYAKVENALTLGKTWDSHNQCEIPFNGKSYKMDSFEVTKPEKYFEWRDASPANKRAMKGTDTLNKKPLIVCRAKGPDNVWHPGKTIGGSDTCYIAYGDSELAIKRPLWQYAMYPEAQRQGTNLKGVPTTRAP